MAEKKVLHDLKSGMVLDHGLFKEMSPDDMSQVIATIRAAGPKRLAVVYGAENFFTPQKLVQLLSMKNKDYLLVNEGLNGFFNDQQINALLGNGQYGVAPEVIKPDALIVNIGGGEAAAENLYTFDKVPEGWSIGGNLSLGPTKIKRKIKNSDGDGTLFFMHPTDMEKLWVFALNAWANDGPLAGTFMTGMGKLKTTVLDDKINVGGNIIRRYEIEQIAKYRMWILPKGAIAV